MSWICSGAPNSVTTAAFMAFSHRGRAESECPLEPLQARRGEAGDNVTGGQDGRPDLPAPSLGTIGGVRRAVGPDRPGAIDARLEAGDRPAV
jgi:hypothetical protein